MLLQLERFAGDYHAAVSKREDGRVTFNGEDFVSSRPAKLRPMLTTLMSSQAFNQFIDERIDELNSRGAPPNDMFEDSISRCREVRGISFVSSGAAVDCWQSFDVPSATASAEA